MVSKKKKIDNEKILGTARADIDWANRFYTDRIEEQLTRRYEIYRSSRERYKRLYPKISEKNELRTFDMWSAVEWMLPNILKAFFGSDRIISIAGVGGEDADRAERVMKLIQWQLTVKNQGYRIFKSWFGDALATNLGVLKCYWKRETKPKVQSGELDEAALVGLLQSGAKILKSEPVMDLAALAGLTSPRSMVEWETEEVTVNQPVIEVVKPSDIRFTPDGRTLGECSMVAHRKLVSLAELKSGADRGVYDAKAVETIFNSTIDEPERTDLEKMLLGTDDSVNQEYAEKARMKVMLYECYMKTDINGDGTLENAIVTVCSDRLLRAVENPYGRTPLFELVPFWDSYQVWSDLGLPEVIQDIQDSHTALLRQMIVSLGLSNQWRAVVDASKINMDDFDSNSMFIRTNGNNPRDAFMPVPAPSLNPQNFSFFEYLKGQKEEWTPLTRYNQGTDATSLNKTATGISMIMSASQQREDEIKRNFAETGISELFRFLITLNQRYMDQPQIVRLQNETLEFTPDDITGEFDLSVDASSGVGARDAKVQALTGYLQQMYPVAVQMGAAGPEQFVLAGQKLLNLMGIEDAEKYLSAPQQQMNPIAALMGGMPGGETTGGGPLQIAGPGGEGQSGLGGAGTMV
ncbi:hypothetical protein FACS1894204_06240 [Synergistales bacterium]|nr:hypothetical protein FACS1894204_06240 [Synergistales bacterium]